MFPTNTICSRCVRKSFARRVPQAIFKSSLLPERPTGFHRPAGFRISASFRNVAHYNYGKTNDGVRFPFQLGNNAIAFRAGIFHGYRRDGLERNRIRIGCMRRSNAGPCASIMGSWLVGMFVTPGKLSEHKSFAPQLGHYSVLLVEECLPTALEAGSTILWIAISCWFSGRLTAIAMQNSIYVPLWNEFCLKICRNDCVSFAWLEYRMA